MQTREICIKSAKLQIVEHSHSRPRGPFAQALNLLLQTYKEPFNFSALPMVNN